MEGRLLFGIILCISFTGIFAGEWCTDYNTDSSDWWDHDANTIWCEEGCCGDGWDQHCCISGEAAMIIGIVIGSIALVAIIVSVLVAVFCCCRKSRGRAGQVCQPNGAQTTTVQMQGMSATNMAYGQVGYNGAVNYPVVTTSNMAPSTVQQWQPPSYDQVYPNKEQSLTH
ncbi:uncharacterized protein LOC123537922 [Mercenaria mercenaria]|uniref:uncharacterized protein LOC123537922 n=1 Tax=Mercenaria mercenaria TaxID=6596 RepID=UPI00234EAB0E|nr:uncharacterized protein LOC123537922 [Mercenaria mercenaria]